MTSIHSPLSLHTLREFMDFFFPFKFMKVSTMSKISKVYLIREKILGGVIEYFTIIFINL
jgi:hypothetical protein